MNSSDSSSHTDLLSQIENSIAREVGRNRAKVARLFARYYFRRVPYDDLKTEDPDDLARMAADLMEFMAQRAEDELLIRVYNPTREEHGWECSHTVIELVNDDMPFLVDSANLAAAEMGLAVHLMIHPVIRIARNSDGQLTHVLEKDDQGGRRESALQLQVDRQTDPALLARIQKVVARSMAEVRLAVSDWEQMTSSVTQAMDELPQWAPRSDKKIIAESQEFLSWAINEHFIFLGVRDYEIVKNGKEHELRVIKGSGLGILRETRKTITSRPLTRFGEEARNKGIKIPLFITKTNARSRIHRVGYMDYIGVLRYDKNGRTTGERRILGLFTSNAYFRTAMSTPLVRIKAQYVLEQSGLVPASHAWKSMVHILETLPRDDLFQASSESLYDLATGVLNLQERLRVRLFIRQERYGRFFSCLVFLPRDKFNTDNRKKIQSILKRALKGVRLDYVVNVSESRLARLQVIIRPKPGVEIVPDVAIIEQKIVEAVRSWPDRLREILVQKHGEDIGLKLASQLVDAFPEAYKEDVPPWVAAFDVENAAALFTGSDLRMSLYRPRKRRGGILRFKLFRADEPLPLSDVMPILENLGLRVVNERPYELNLPDGRRLWIQDFDMLPVARYELNVEVLRELFQEAFERTLRGLADSDGFNQLVIAAQFHWRQVKLLRAYCKYLLQTPVAFSQSYMAETLAKHPLLARLLLELFEASFDPARDEESDFRKEQGLKHLRRNIDSTLDEDFSADKVLIEYLDDVVAAREMKRDIQVKCLKNAFLRALGSVPSLDEDRILHTFYAVIRATLRTNYFQCNEDGVPDNHIVFKFDSGALPNLPAPRPYREIWVYSPRFEGIHLRGGKIARGGLRWSDRREDFRTEVLGLMKAQNVKNTMIVPVGAKGGFVAKRLPESGSRDQILEEVINCYKSFINGLLDITDNLDEDSVVSPRDLVKRDEDDPYLVVAADKGTASFSDIANAIALEKGFWLGDAFASGGSNGYDHKAMGITAKGAWEGVKRHFRELGKNIQKEPFSVVGIGDMSGDVFGNGMLLSKHIMLKAAFNHMHIFIDPDPDPESALKERRRLFRKVRSSWADYDLDIVSKGGGVWSRLDKTIPLSPEIKAWLGLEVDQLAPHELIRELLKADVDLLWNGGIGTYVKASTQSHIDAGDLANNQLRINGNELRCKVVGEGGNLGLTQEGRIEYAINGGRINTDFIDNSAGVDCSDHEVNIKILLDQVCSNGQLDQKARNRLLAEMTRDVSALVVRSNYLQTQAISMMEQLTGARLGAKQHFISVLEMEGILDRNLEGLPDDDELTARRNRGEGLTRPELAVLLSYSKIRLYQQLLASDVPEDSYLSTELVRYFPEALQQKYRKEITRHRLRREIIATQVTNSLVNRMGASFTLRMHEDTGASPSEVAKAFSIAREVFKAREFWAGIEKLDNKADSEAQNRATLMMWNLMRQATRWLLNLSGPVIDIDAQILRLQPGLTRLAGYIRKSIPEEDRLVIAEETQRFMESGFPKKLALRTAMLPRLFTTLDVVETAAQQTIDVVRVANVYYGLGEALELIWLRKQVNNLPVEGQWHAHARRSLRDQLLLHHNQLVNLVLKSAGRQSDPMAYWLEKHSEDVTKVIDMLRDMKNLPTMDYATAAVAVGSLGKMAK
jgi:glutamate dehydrogenase